MPNKVQPQWSSEEDFNSILDRIEKLYNPIIEEKGGNLIVTRNWESGTINAYARRLEKIGKFQCLEVWPDMKQ